MPWKNNIMTDIVPTRRKKALPESPPYKGRLITESKKCGADCAAGMTDNSYLLLPFSQQSSGTAVFAMAFS